jgi:uncharacterized repeat protein (TIGR01451 family)/MYXO-CTERM domain-containing protein
MLAALLAPRVAAADPALRIQKDIKGDFVLFGNTVAQDCAMLTPPIPAPVVGTRGTCPDGNAYAPDVYWRSDDPAAGQALADSSLAPGAARSTAVLLLPNGASVVYARLYWGALSAASGPDPSVRVQRVSNGLDVLVSADSSSRVNDGSTGRFWYQSTADVTDLVKAQGAGAYRLAEIESVNLVGLNDTHPVIAWFMVVMYQRDGEPSRNLAIFDGLDLVDQTIGSAAATLSGFLVPDAGFDAKLGVIAYEGEAQLTGDSLRFNNTTLSNAVNPANNFFNATRSYLGSAQTVVGDLPQLTGAPRSLSNVDFDVVSVTNLVAAGDSSATIEATSTSDTYLLGAFVTSISTFKPEFVTSQKSVSDLNGGALRPGDQLEYRVEVHNTGSDTSTNTVLSDVLPSAVSYVPGSIEIVSGANAGAKTDASGDDQADFNAGTGTVTVRLGTGANANSGGQLAIDASAVVRFRVTVHADASGTISNQAVINAQGQKGAPAESTVTDGNGVESGQPPTVVNVDACESDADCSAPTPRCDVASSPQTCAACLSSADCSDAQRPDCNSSTHACECAGSSCTDSDGDGSSDAMEMQLGTDPHDADSDDDGVSDGSELAGDKDSDGDGVINALDPDSDNDGLFDGTELGLDCSGAATDVTRGHCRPDADSGRTTTSPVAADTDGGGARDGSEDFNLDGAIDPGETDPTLGHSADDSTVGDRDHDGLGDALEMTLHSDPDDADSDDDGALDGEEANPSDDGDGDKLVSVLDVDSDDDALYDGTELGKPCDRAATLAAAGHCRADSDAGASKTSPVARDSDRGGASDGSEDSNLNGIVDGSESDPTLGHGSDDGAAANADTDADGLSDALETTLGSDALDADSDDDGAPDGGEANPGDDADGDGKLDVLDPDSDGDGLFDGTEQGRACDGSATDNSKHQCTADADMGATRTSPVRADTDFGGRGDGAEDADKNGRIDSGETDPNDPHDDKLGSVCTSDSDCGASDSGVVCEKKVCAMGCRGRDGNACPKDRDCSSTTQQAGQCVAKGTLPDAGMSMPADAGTSSGMDAGSARDAGKLSEAGGAAGNSAEPGSTGSGGKQGSKSSTKPVPGTLGGGGCNCRAAGDPFPHGDLAAVLPALLALVLRRRRRTC